MILRRTNSQAITAGRRDGKSPLGGLYVIDAQDRWILTEGEDPLFDNPFTLFTEWDSDEDKGFDNL